MHARNRCRLFAVALACVAALRCSWDAPRDNPLDPALGGNIIGRVLTRRATAIIGARVSVPDAGQMVGTDSSGDFELHGLPDESVWVFVAADGYAPESARLVLARGRIDSLTTYLDGSPYLRDCGITTHVYGRGWPPEPLKFCTLTAEADDIDGESDVDSVWVEIPAIDYSKRLSYDSDNNVFVQTLWAKDLPGQTL